MKSNKNKTFRGWLHWTEALRLENCKRRTIMNKLWAKELCERYATIKKILLRRGERRKSNKNYLRPDKENELDSSLRDLSRLARKERGHDSV